MSLTIAQISALDWPSGSDREVAIETGDLSFSQSAPQSVLSGSHKPGRPQSVHTVCIQLAHAYVRVLSVSKKGGCSVTSLSVQFEARVVNTRDVFTPLV